MTVDPETVTAYHSSPPSPLRAVELWVQAAAKAGIDYIEIVGGPSAHNHYDNGDDGVVMIDGETFCVWSEDIGDGEAAVHACRLDPDTLVPGPESLPDGSDRLTELGWTVDRIDTGIELTDPAGNVLCLCHTEIGSDAVLWVSKGAQHQAGAPK